MAAFEAGRRITCRAECATRRALPEIYYHSMARQWADLSRLAVRRFGFGPHEARRALVRELGRHPRTRLRSLGPLTNIRTA